MTLVRFSVRGVICVATATVLSACAQHGAFMPATSFVPQQIALPDLTPPKCKGQKSTKNYASLTVTLSTKGGSFCVPEFGGFGGTIEYPGANPSVKLALISSTTDYNHLPQLGTGTAIFYLQLAISGGTAFGNQVPAGGGLAAKKLVPEKPYTSYGQAKIFGYTFKFGPCVATAKKSKYGGSIGGIGTLLKGAHVPSAASGLIEIYSGKQTATPC
ncbi:MAG: hypothetical protein WAK84_08325 [Candidatus Cybelea sp.]